MEKSDFIEFESCLTGYFFSFDLTTRKLLHLGEQIWAITGFSADELQKMNFDKVAKLVNEEDREKMTQEIKKSSAFQTGEGLTIVFRFLTKEESWVWLEGNIRLKSNKIYGYVHDISEIKGLELGYIHRTSHVMTLMNAIPGYVSWLKNDLTYIGVNETLAAASGVTQEAFTGQAYGFLSTYIDENTENKTKNWLLAFSKNKPEKITQTETQLRGPYGTRHFLLSAAKYGDQDNIVLIGIDHTKLKELEKEIETEKARNIHQARMAALGEMASGIAHEINNPLQIILGVSAEVIKSEQFKKPGEMLVRAADRIAKIVKGLKTFSRDGELDPVESCLISSIIKDTVDFAQANFKRRDADLTVEPYDEKLEAECRPVQISQVIMVLCNNALDAIEHLPKKWVKISVIDLGREIEIAVTDSGSGISPEIAEKIMNPFFTTKPTGKGTGLGLSISTGILKTHHGVIGLDENSKNTRFYIRWPKVQPKTKDQKSYRD